MELQSHSWSCATTASNVTIIATLIKKELLVKQILLEVIN